jgi:hypothetical protein
MDFGCIACFDNELENKVTSIWKRFENANIGNTPGSFGEDPHICMFLAKDQRAESIIENINQFENKQVHVVLLPYGVFNGTRKVVFLNVIVTNELINFRNKIFDIINNCNVVVDEWYKNDRALLHCTIALDIDDKDISNAVQIMSTLEPAYAGFINRLQIIEGFPIQKRLELKMSI